MKYIVRFLKEKEVNPEILELIKEKGIKVVSPLVPWEPSKKAPRKGREICDILDSNNKEHTFYRAPDGIWYDSDVKRVADKELCKIFNYMVKRSLRPHTEERPFCSEVLFIADEEIAKRVDNILKEASLDKSTLVFDLGDCSPESVLHEDIWEKGINPKQRAS